ncbi:hypothetical protein AGMMS49975_23010 [Clostridia bacterium]|nr:hypothetical protein AGMMS49975_23010 [Clostridia bacterium]
MIDDLSVIISEGESYTVEFKENPDKELPTEVCAFANASGGKVYIVSPGGLCKGITPENFGTVTITRNPIIASMFFRIDYIEQMGTGIGRMRNATREANVAEPEFEFAGFFKVTFRRNNAQATAASDRQAIEKERYSHISSSTPK